MTKIQGKEIIIERDYLSPVTYVPLHAHGNAGHKDCEQGVIIRFNERGVFVLYCKSRTVQLTNPENLVWG